MSLDYGSDSPLSVDQISFNSLKEKAVTGEVLAVTGTEQLTTGVAGSISYQEAVGKASDLASICNSGYWSMQLMMTNFIPFLGTSGL